MGQLKQWKRGFHEVVKWNESKNFGMFFTKGVCCKTGYVQMEIGKLESSRKMKVFGLENVKKYW